MEAETLGSRIRAKRLKLRITEEKLASLVGLNVRTINRIEVDLTPVVFLADYLPLIAAELGTTTEILLNGELQSEPATREELLTMRKDGIIRSDDELYRLNELAMGTIRQRNNANIPLNRLELMNLIELLRGSDGL